MSHKFIAKTIYGLVLAALFGLLVYSAEQAWMNGQKLTSVVHNMDSLRHDITQLKKAMLLELVHNPKADKVIQSLYGADVKKGVGFFRKGDFAKAYEALAPAAKSGNQYARYAIEFGNEHLIDRLNSSEAEIGPVEAKELEGWFKPQERQSSTSATNSLVFPSGSTTGVGSALKRLRHLVSKTHKREKAPPSGTK